MDAFLARALPEILRVTIAFEVPYNESTKNLEWLSWIYDGNGWSRRCERSLDYSKFVIGKVGVTRVCALAATR